MVENDPPNYLFSLQQTILVLHGGKHHASELRQTLEAID